MRKFDLKFNPEKCSQVIAQFLKKNNDYWSDHFLKLACYVFDRELIIRGYLPICGTSYTYGIDGAPHGIVPFEVDDIITNLGSLHSNIDFYFRRSVEDPWFIELARDPGDGLLNDFECDLVDQIMHMISQKPLMLLSFQSYEHDYVRSNSINTLTIEDILRENGAPDEVYEHFDYVLRMRLPF